MANLVQTYGSQQRLLENNRYKVTFELDGESATFSFTSRYNPMYSSVKVIRSDFPDLLQDLKDDTINFLIWQASQLVDVLVEDAGTTVGENVQIFARKQYVRYRTEYDLVRNILIANATNGGMQEKHLGEFKITREVRLNELDSILKGLKEELTKWEGMLSLQALTTSAVRAGGTAFPLAARVSF